VFLTEGLNANTSPSIGVVEILDASDPANPHPIGSYERQHQASSADTLIRTVTVSGSHAYVTSVSREVSGAGGYVNTVDVLDVSDPTNPRRIGGHNNLSSGFPFATVSGDRVFFCDAVAGLSIIDASGQATLNRISSTRTPGDAVGVAVSANNAFVADAQAGLQVLDVSDPSNPRLIANAFTDGIAYAVQVANNRAYVAYGESGLQIYDVSNASNPQFLGSFDTPGQARGVALEGNVAFIADGTGGVAVVDVADPANPQLLATHRTTGRASSVHLLDNHLLVGDREGGLLVLDVSTPANPVILADYNPGGYVVAVATSGHYAYIADGFTGFQVMDLSDPGTPKVVGTSPGGGYARGIAVSGRFVYVTDALSGVQVYDVADPTQPRLMGGNSALDAYGITVAGGKVLAVGGAEGLGVFEAFTPPLQLGIKQGATAGAVELRVDGPPQLSIRLQRSSDLLNWEDWQAFTLGAMPKTISDLSAGSEPKRFYRAVSP
jgi:hypothetical protein